MTFEQVVDFAVAHHIQYLELISSHLDPNAPVAEIERKKAILDQHGLIPYAFGVASTTADKRENRKLFEFAHRIGAKLIVVEPEMADWDSLEALVKEYDIRLAIHNHWLGTTYGDPQAVKQVLARRDRRIGVCLDVGWVTAAGFDAAKVFRDYGDRVYDIHFKDKKLPMANDRQAVDTTLGAGNANYPGLFAEIKRTGWSGVMAIETDSEEFATDPRYFVSDAAWFFARQTEEEEWIQLFNGHNLDGWTPKITHHDLGDNFGNTFRVEDGLLKVRYDQYTGFGGHFGHLFYRTPYSYYKLVVEYRFVGEQAPDGPGKWALRNNGVMLHSQDPRTMLRDQAFPVSIEAQLLGGLSNGQSRSTMNVCNPGIDVVYEGRIYRPNEPAFRNLPKTSDCLSASSGTFDGDQWVHVEMDVLGSGTIIHFVNGKQVVEYALPQYQEDVETNFGLTGTTAHELVESGYIALQSESHPIDFRKVELLNLSGCMDLKAKNYKSYYVKSRPEGCVY